MGFHPRTESCEEWHECATWGVIEQAKDLLGPQGGFTADIWKYDAFMDQNSQAASLLLNNKTIRAKRDSWQPYKRTRKFDSVCYTCCAIASFVLPPFGRGWAAR